MQIVSNMRISIIIPVYNVEPYVEKCILSVLRQNYSNLEVVIVDDKTPDESMKKIEGVLFVFYRFAEILYITKNGVRTEHYVQLTFDELKQVAGGKCLIESELYGLDEMINDLDNSDICNSDIHKSSGNKIHSFERSPELYLQA